MESQSLEQILLTMELITREQLTDALEYQCRLPKSEQMSLADILVDMEYVSMEAIESIENYLFVPPPVDNVAERIRRSVEGTVSQASPSVRPSLSQHFDPTYVAPEAAPLDLPSTSEPLPPSVSLETVTAQPSTPGADEEWQRMHAMEEWQQMQSLCVEESKEDKENLEKIMGDLGISDPRALQVGFTIKRKP
jgi:hypothetical protein